VLGHIRLLVLDLDYLVFDCAILKAQALRQSLIEFADAIPQSAHLPDAADAEEGFCGHGRYWTQFLEIGLNEEQQAGLQKVYDFHEKQLIQAGVGRIYSALEKELGVCLSENISLALGADASRGYLMAVSDRHDLHSFFDITMCTEEFGSGSAVEMLDEIMLQAGVNPSEMLVLGTRPPMFQSARSLGMKTIGCGWGLHQHNGLAEADLQVLAPAELFPAIAKADDIASQCDSE
jgi:phosphoglycolate phosphatase-like HAD superfamily hydrolase